MLGIYCPQKQPSTTESCSWQRNIQFPVLWWAISKAHSTLALRRPQQYGAPAAHSSNPLTDAHFIGPSPSLSTLLLVQINYPWPSPCHRFCFWGHANFKKLESCGMTTHMQILCFLFSSWWFSDSVCTIRSCRGLLKSVLKMALLNAMHFFPLSTVILNLLNNLIQVTFIEYLLHTSWILPHISSENFPVLFF